MTTADVDADDGSSDLDKIDRDSAEHKARVLPEYDGADSRAPATADSLGPRPIASWGGPRPAQRTQIVVNWPPARPLPHPRRCP